MITLVIGGIRSGKTEFSENLLKDKKISIILQQCLILMMKQMKE